MGEAIVFTSGKGGVGKTTTIANIGAGLSRLDKKVIMLDTDMGLRNLDVVMGMEDQIQYNLIDLLENKCRLKQALIRDKRYPNLFMIPAALRCRKIMDYESKLYTLISHLKQEFDFLSQIELSSRKWRALSLCRICSSDVSTKPLRCSHGSENQ